jgi:hypothetical protein
MKFRIISVISALFILVSACSSPEKKAKEQLTLHGYEFSESDFINAVQEDNTEAVKLFLDAGMSQNETSPYVSVFDTAGDTLLYVL